ncbi:PAS domain-containing sensor histidine kinase [Dyadobacter frigoris]|uniref:Sensor protein FixL n=1 Tax=Dyadobacter frigoris TaxID=2576211 RepID=A0A4U6CXV7_9BACT|nr:PAS domain-containing sensor histidine kinase [Dyadobacter frigoris]TKT86254.1 PAS domain S-box protein [Dyadobacter frigoris]GLU56905.1 PAS domain-containing sensor histidine kinase [Dyadobacter frigoris]
MENSALLKAIIENAIDGIITIDNKGTIETINPSGCQLFEYDQSEVIGQNISMLMPPPDRDQHDNYLLNYHQTSKKSIIGTGREVTGLRKSGAVFPFRLGISEVQFSGRKIYTGFIHDLSREKHAEEKLKEYAIHLEDQVQQRTRLLNETVTALGEAKEKVSKLLEKEMELGQLKSRFVSMASHEFRTPLSAIQLSSILIEKYSGDSISPNISRHTAKIKVLVAHLTGVLNDFLSLERLEAGEFKPVLTEFDIVKFSEEITEDMQLISKQNQQIIYQHTGTSATVNLDQSLLRNAIINLISNAIKYSGENTFIEFNTEITPALVTVCIKDNGIGIPKEDQKHLFEAFFRAHNTGTIPGTGLGLNIVSRYIKLMDGQVKFTSNVNQGTSFTLSFPKQP